MNNLIASLFNPSETLDDRALHFAFHSVGLIASNSLLPLQLRIHTKTPILWSKTSIIFHALVFLDLHLLWNIVVVIKFWSLSYTSAVTPQTIHAAWLHHTFSARFGSWKLLHIWEPKSWITTHREKGFFWIWFDLKWWCFWRFLYENLWLCFLFVVWHLFLCL